MAKRIVAFEVPSALCLYDKDFGWKPAVRGDSLSSLAKIFLQFGNEVDTGEVFNVCMESVATLTPEPQSQNSTPSATPTMRPTSASRGRRRYDRKTAVAETISIANAKNPTVCVVIFHEADSDEMKKTAAVLLDKFMVRYGQKVVEWGPRCRSIADGMDHTPSADILREFHDFDADVTSILSPS
jgi:hypothetical protein